MAVLMKQIFGEILYTRNFHLSSIRILIIHSFPPCRKKKYHTGDARFIPAIMQKPTIIYCRSLKNISFSQSDFTLHGGESHIFYFPINDHSISENHLNALTPAEREKVAKFRKTSDAELFIAARIFPKLILQFYTRSKFKIIADEQNKPQISISDPRETLCFNLSHTEGLLVIAISRTEVGIDAEFVKSPVPAGLKEECFSPAEQTLINTSDFPAETFYTLWTRKESLLKADGAGLIDCLSELEIHASRNKASLSILFKYPTYCVTSFLLNNYVCSICNTSGNFEPLKIFDGGTLIKNL